MKFQIKQNELNKGIKLAKQGVGTNNTMPVLNFFKMEAKEDSVVITGTDLETRIEVDMDADVETKGTVLIESKTFAQLINSFSKNDLINIYEDNNIIKVETNESSFEFNTFDPEEYPEKYSEPLKITEFKTKLDKLNSIISKTLFARAVKDADSRPVLAGLHLESTDDGLDVVATNTYRLALAKMDNINEDDINCIIPSEPLKTLNKMKTEEVTVKIHKNSYIEFITENVLINSRLIDGDYVKYNAVITDSYKTQFIVSKEDLKASLKRASIIAKQENNVITLTVDENMTIKADNDSGTAEEQIDINELEGPIQKIAFDVGYLLDMVKNTKGKYKIQLTDKVNPIVIKNIVREENEEGEYEEVEKDYTYLIMPIRTN